MLKIQPPRPKRNGFRVFQRFMRSSFCLYTLYGNWKAMIKRLQSEHLFQTPDFLGESDLLAICACRAPNFAKNHIKFNFIIADLKKK